MNEKTDYWFVELVVYGIEYSDTDLVFDVRDDCIEIMS